MFLSERRADALVLGVIGKFYHCLGNGIREGGGGVWEIVLSGFPDRWAELFPAPFIHFQFNELHWYESSQTILPRQLHTIDMWFRPWLKLLWVLACGFLCVSLCARSNWILKTAIKSCVWECNKKQGGNFGSTLFDASIYIITLYDAL